MATDRRVLAGDRKENLWERGKRMIREHGEERWPGVDQKALPAGVAEELRGVKILREALGIPDGGPS